MSPLKKRDRNTFVPEKNSTKYMIIQFVGKTFDNKSVSQSQIKCLKKKFLNSPHKNNILCISVQNLHQN